MDTTTLNSDISHQQNAKSATTEMLVIENMSYGDWISS